MPRPAIPRFFLYGEPVRDVELRFLHIETIEARSRPNGWSIQPHSHAELAQMLYVHEGDGEMRAEAQRWTFRAPALLLMPPRVAHGFLFRPDTVGHVVTVAEPFLAELCHQDGFPRLPACLGLTREQQAAHELPAVCAAIEREFVWSAPARGIAVQAHLLRLVVAAIRLLSDHAPEAQARDRDSELVARYREILETEFRTDAPIAAHAARLGVTAGRLTAACRRRLGRSPLELLHDRLLLEAKRALLYTPHTVAEIAYALGFKDPAYFSRFFQKRTNETATEFRARHQR
jgi:AraC family transcriptional activator of pobA